MIKVRIKMPKLAVSMREGILSSWLVKRGEAVAKGQPIYTVEADKSEQEIESPVNGRITPLVDAGTTCAVGTPVAEIELEEPQA